jgi:hypothetical protein
MLSVASAVIDLAALLPFELACSLSLTEFDVLLLQNRDDLGRLDSTG